MLPYSCKKVLLTLFFAVGCILITVSCAALPTYNLSDGGDPAEVVTRFLDGVISGNDVDLSDLVYNYTWQSGLDTPFDGAAVSKTDLAVLHCIKESRRYELTGESAIAEDAHHATVTVNYTSFDVGQFQEKLTEKVVAEVKQRQYEGEVFANSSDTVDIIEQYKAALLQSPEDFYTTRPYAVELVSSKGRWKIVLSDEFYNALTGYGDVRQATGNVR